MAAHARAVNICIWSSLKSVGHETNDCVMVHGEGTRADGRRFSSSAQIDAIVGSRVGQAAGAYGGLLCNVLGVKPSWMDRPRTEAPQTRIYFTTHGSGANSVPRVRTVVRGERASRSIVNRTTALWSIWIVASLILADLCSGLAFVKTLGREIFVSRGSNGPSNVAQ